MKAILRRAKALVCTAALCTILLTGCGPKPQASPPAAAASAAPEQTPEQRAQEQARVLQTIRTMTPDQRAAYFKAHPGDAAAVANR